MTQNASRLRITKLTIALAAILPIITTVILLWQHSSEHGNPAVFGRWTYQFFIIALLPTIAMLPALAFLLLRRSLNAISLAVAILSLFAFLALVEVATYTKAANIFSPRFITFIPDSCVRERIAGKRGFAREFDFIQVDGVPGRRARPYMEFTDWTPDEKGHTRLFRRKLDRNGFHNAESVAGLPSIGLAIVGGSFTDGPAEENYVSVASRLLNRPVLNLGVGGTGPYQQRWAVEQIGLAYKPKVVVWQFYITDIFETVSMGTWLSDNRGLTWGEFSASARHTETNLSFRPEKCRIIALNYPFLFLGLVQQTRTQISQAGLGIVQTVQIAGDSAGASPRYFEFPTSDFSPTSMCSYPLSMSEWQDTARVSSHGTVIELDVAMRQALDLVEAEIRELAATGESAGFDLVLMPMPTKYLVYEDQILGHLRSAGRDLACLDGRAPRLQRGEYYYIEWLRDIGAKYDLDYLDLLSYLRQEAVDGRYDLLYYTLDVHLNDEGNAVTGRFLQQELQGMIR